jgi:integrase/recombinase XerC
VHSDLSQQIHAFILSRKVAGCTPATLAFYGNVLGQLAKVACWPLISADLQTFLLQKSDTCNAVSYRTYYRALKVFCNWLANTRRLESNPIANLERPRNLRRKIPKEAPPGALKRLFRTLARAADDDELAVRDYAMFRLIHDTGLRASEAAHLRVHDVDMIRQEIVVRDGKGQQDRVVYFGRSARAALIDWLEVRPECPWLFVSRLRCRLRPLTPKGIYTALQKWCGLAKVERFSVHALRHSYACDALDAGIHLKHIQVQMGHKNLSTTAIYLHRRDPDRRRAHLEHSPGDWLDSL